MSHFEVPVVRITKVEDHPNADRLSLVYFREFITISAKLEDGSHRHSEGDLIIYVPEGAVVPEYLLKQGFWDENKSKGILAGSKGNRVKAIKLRDVMSQGIMFPVEPITDSPEHEFFRGADGVIHNHEGTAKPVIEGDDVAEFLSVVKYEPPIPASMSGQVRGTPIYLPKHDVENIKKYPDYFKETDNIVITEKIHGTMTGIGFDPRVSDEPFVFSKGLGAKGMVFKREDNESNLYVQMLIKEGYIDRLKIITLNYLKMTRNITDIENESVYFFGETYGKGVQDLHYDGMNAANLRLFDMCFLENGEYVWVDMLKFLECCHMSGVPFVPYLHEGRAYDMKLLRDKYRDGSSELGNNIKEGIVIRKTDEHKSSERLVLKDISDDYLTRKGGTELT